ncbi:hypothetical protein ACFWNN_13565 [Lentzea sp. NPDC058450]|uniref:hypothetical protein n=1 Tax=Lentzea sp. NPDC058450 TaxID=3346505 RepID=UPI0036663668
MDLPGVLTLIGLVVLIVIGVFALTKSGEETAKLRSAKVADSVLGHYATRPGWSHVPSGDPVPAGRMSTAYDVKRRTAVAGTHEGRAVRVAVFGSYVPNRAAGAQNGTATFGLVVAFDAPELPADLRVDTGARMFSELATYQVPAVDVGDGVACFTFTDLTVAEELDHVIGLTHDVVKALVAA